MAQVFISYRQTDDEQRQRVREFAERLRNAGVDVILDQFFLDVNPGGPDEGWDKWSSDRALHTEFVLIIGTQDWFECFEKTQPSGTGYGAACEADDIRARIYKASGIVKAIRVVLFDDLDATYIPAKLDRYHCFHAERNFADVVRWLGEDMIVDRVRTSIPHNLPSLQPFFGREYELRKIADALDPERRTWGAIIDGPGGMGKTSLAVRAAYDAPPDAFEKIVFISLKSRELDDDGVRDLSGFLIGGLAELLNELARELGYAEIAKASEDQRPRKLLDILRGTRTLLILDNLESLLKHERDVIFTFINRLPVGCKAILTSRGRIGSGAEELILEKLSEEAALATLAKLAESNSVLANTSEAERLDLYRETGGKPLLLRWTAGQIGRGSCITLSDAINYLRSCPEGNDPLEFIFGDLAEDFSAVETQVLCALTYFTLPARIEHIAELAECSAAETDRSLRSLANRSLVVPSEELKVFSLVPLVADFLRKKRPEAVAETGDRLEKQVYALVMENGRDNYERFPMLDVDWLRVVAALPRFVAGPNNQLQEICEALQEFLNFTGRWDELFALSRDAENSAVAVSDFLNAGWHAYRIGWFHYMRGQSTQVLVSARRAESHWHKAKAGTFERATAIRLRGVGYQRERNYAGAIEVFREAIDLFRTLDQESRAVAMTLNDLADVEDLSGDVDSAKRDFEEALRIARTIDYVEGVAYLTGNLAGLALRRHDWPEAEALAREALSLSEKIGRQEIIGYACLNLAEALRQQHKNVEAIAHAQRAVDIFMRLGSRNLEPARKVLARCET